MIKIFIQAVLGTFDRHAFHGIEKFVNTELPAGRIHNMADKMFKHKNIANLMALDDVFQQYRINIALQYFDAKIAIQFLYFRETSNFKIIFYGLAQYGGRVRAKRFWTAGKKPVKFQKFLKTEREYFYG